MEKTVSHCFMEARLRPATQVALRYSKNGHWKDISWAGYFEMAEKLGSALVSLGVKRGDRVAIMSNTRYEWNISDMAILGIGAVTIPLYQNNTIEDVEFIINNSQATAVLFEDMAQYKKLEQLQGKIPALKTYVSFTACDVKDVITLDQAFELGKKFLAKQPDFFKNECQKNKISDIATVVYTSGTTGQPKGAVLLHECIASECEDVKPILDLNDSDTSLTFLPFAHIFGRVELWAHIYLGWKMAFAESIDRIAANMLEIKPTMMLAVPRIYEKIYARVISQVDDGSAIKKKIFYWAVGIGREVSLAKREKREVPFKTLLQYRLAYKLVFSKLQEKMGNRIRFMVSGGAPISKEILEFFHAAGILILEGYGLTETTAGVFFNNPYKYNFGTVGLPIGDVEVKIADDGEILIKSKKIFKEYFQNPEATKESLENGWFHTGDIGAVDSEGFLRITDRKKDMIKTAGGKMIAPQKIENVLKISKMISQAAIYGDKMKYIVALITLNPEELLKFAAAQGLGTKDYTELTKNPKVQDLIRDIVKEKNSELASYETVKNFTILPHDFTVESGEVTPSLKVKRRFVGEKYSAEIKELYS